MIKTIFEFDNGNYFCNHCIITGQNHREYKSHYHDVYEILFVKSGGTFYQIDGESIPLHKNTLVLSRPGHPHYIQMDELLPYERYNLLFPKEILSQEILSELPENLHTVNLNDNQVMIHLFEKMDYYCGYLEGEALSVVIRALIQEIIISTLIHINTTNGSALYDRHPLTEKAIDFIDSNLISIQSVEEICIALSVSKSYLYQLFMHDLHMTPKRYIMQRRLNMARREMLSGAKATAVYSQCGFADYSAFFRAYKKFFGYPPNQTNQSIPGTYLL